MPSKTPKALTWSLLELSPARLFQCLVQERFVEALQGLLKDLIGRMKARNGKAVRLPMSSYELFKGLVRLATTLITRPPIKSLR